VEVASGRHLLLWSHDGAEQAGWDAAGVSGRLQPDSLMVALHNRGANKLDQFVKVNATLDTRELSQGTQVTLEVSMRNTTPTDLPPKVAGPFPGAVGAADGRYQGLLVLQLPGSAADVTMEDAELVANGPDGNSRVLATYVELDRGGATDRTITFVLPKDDRTLRIEASARVPGVGWTADGERWVDETARVVSW
jgi:hypothetical protein